MISVHECYHRDGTCMISLPRAKRFRANILRYFTSGDKKVVHRRLRIIRSPSRASWLIHDYVAEFRPHISASGPYQPLSSSGKP